MKLKGIIADHPTPKISSTDISYSLTSTDYHRGGVYNSNL